MKALQTPSRSKTDLELATLTNYKILAQKKQIQGKGDIEEGEKTLKNT